MTRKQAVEFLLDTPYKFGHLVGFTKLTELHNKWILDMIRCKDDKTLQAHRGSYKTTCVSIALALIMVLLPNKKTLFLLLMLFMLFTFKWVVVSPLSQNLRF